MGSPARAFEGGDHGFQAEADGLHRAFGCVAARSGYRWRAVCVGKDRAARTPDRVAATAAQGTSGRARANAKEDRKGGSKGGSGASPSGSATCRHCVHQGPARTASAGKGESDAGRLHRGGVGVAPTQHGQRHWNGVRDNPVSVFTALQRARISWNRAAEPDLVARRRQHRPLPEAFRILRVGLPGRRPNIELQPEQQLGSAPATRLFHL
jgi:hypothetical protein